MANLRVDKITSTETFETTGSVQFFRVPTSRLTTDLGSGLDDNFTIEFWILASAIASGSNSPGMFQLSDTSGGLKASTESLALAWSTTNGYSIFYAGSIGTGSITNDPNENDVWKHYAMVRNNGVLKIYVDGVEKTSANITDDFSGYRYLAIGTYYSTSYPWQGHISNFRIVNNSALYTKNFTPPTRELTVTPETVLLACQHKTDATHEKTGKTITVNGNAVASELTPGLLTDVVKSGGNSAITGSVEFDGTGDYLSIPNSSDLRLNQTNEDFTIECWTNTSNSSGQFIVGLWETTNNRRSWILWFDQTSGPKPAFVWSTTGSNTIGLLGNTVKKNEWYHIAVVKSSSTIKLYVNGVEEASNNSVTGTFFAATTDNIQIGADWTNARYLQGFISNLRIIKGKALYTANFIPPTRELKKVPGTVLLCCQDSNNPTTEATGKTITGYGDLQKADGVELISNGSFATVADGETGYDNGDGTVDGWTTGQSASLSVVSNRLRVTNGTSDYGIAQTSITTVVGKVYRVTADFVPGTGTIGDLRASSVSLSNNLGTTGLNSTTRKSLTFTATTTTTYINVYGDNVNGNYTDWDNISVTLAETRNGASDFTPQVGNDGSVEFVGPTKINTENYFYLPTGDTESREATGTYNAGTRGVALGGDASSPNPDTIIDYITIASTGDAKDFGDLTVSDSLNGDAVADHTRGVCFGGRSNTPTPNSTTNAIQFVTISSTGNSQDFGDLVGMKYGMAGFSDSTRGISAGGGVTPDSTANIDYITISSKGNGQDFGDCINTITYSAGFSSPTRGIKAGGANTPGGGTETNHIEYVTIQTTGNAQDFGDLVTPAWRLAGCSNSVRGVILEGESPAGDGLNAISYVTIASMGNAQDFGDATTAGQHSNGTSSSTRGVFMGRQGASPYANLTFIDFVQIMTTANAQDFGDLTVGRQGVNACSNGHGGLG